MKLFSLSLLLISCISLAGTAKIKRKPKKPRFRQYSEKIYFNYFMQFLGPSLSPDYQNGATYNRFKTGQDFKGDELDSTSSQQMYHSITFGYHLSNDYKFNYSYTFQDDLNKGITYSDYFGDEATRPKGVTDNNKRFNLMVYNIINNDTLNFNVNYFYEISSTLQSVYQDMEYGLGIQPSFNFYTSAPSIMWGVNFLIQRNYYKNNEILFEGNLYPTKYQTSLVQFEPFISYQLDDYWSFRSSFTFDWDQRGDEVNSTEVFNKNMHDVGRLSANVLIDYGVTAGAFLEYGLEEASLKKTALGLTLNFSLF